MRLLELGGGSLAGLVLAVTAGCEKPGSVHATTPVAAPSAVPAASLPRAPASEWTVRPRFRIEADEGTAVASQCFPAINDVLPLEGGTTWVFGNCGLRIRLEPGGGYTDFTAPWEPLHVPLGIAPFCCAAMPDFSAAAERGPSDVFVAAGTSCQMDPSSVTQLPLEHYDGASWKKASGAFPEDPHEAGISALLWGGRTLYALAVGDDGSDFHCSVHRLEADRWKPVRRCARAGKARERFTSMAIDPRGRPWICGSRESASGRLGMIAFLDGETWTEESSGHAELTALSIAPDGAVWMGNANSLSRRTGAGITVETPLPAEFDLGSILARSESEVWVGGANEVLGIVGTVTERFQLKEKDSGRRLTVRAAGDSIWAFEGLTVWELSRSANLLPLVAQKAHGVTQEEAEEVSRRPVRGPRACKASKP
jgi:hypothetical protein